MMGKLNNTMLTMYDDDIRRNNVICYAIKFNDRACIFIVS